MQGEEQLVWETYFGGREYDPQFDKVARKFGPFFERVLGDKGGAEYREASGRITLHFRTLAEDAEMGGMVAEAISQRPTDTLACMEFAAHRVLSRRAPLARRVHVRIIESPTRTKLKRLKANLIDRFFATRGTVVRVGNIRPLITRMTFECAKCGCRETRHFAAISRIKQGERRSRRRQAWRSARAAAEAAGEVVDKAFMRRWQASHK